MKTYDGANKRKVLKNFKMALAANPNSSDAGYKFGSDLIDTLQTNWRTRHATIGEIAQHLAKLERELMPFEAGFWNHTHRR